MVKRSVLIIVLMGALLAWAGAASTLVRWFESSRTLQRIHGEVEMVSADGEQQHVISARVRFSNHGRVMTRFNHVSARLYHPTGLVASLSMPLPGYTVLPQNDVHFTLPFESRLAAANLPTYDALTEWRVELVLSVSQPVHRGALTMAMTLDYSPSAEEANP